MLRDGSFRPPDMFCGRRPPPGFLPWPGGCGSMLGLRRVRRRAGCAGFRYRRIRLGRWGRRYHDRGVGAWLPGRQRRRDRRRGDRLVGGAGRCHPDHERGEHGRKKNAGSVGHERTVSGPSKKRCADHDCSRHSRQTLSAVSARPQALATEFPAQMPIVGADRSRPTPKSDRFSPGAAVAKPHRCRVAVPGLPDRRPTRGVASSGSSDFPDRMERLAVVARAVTHGNCKFLPIRELAVLRPSNNRLSLG